MSNILPVCEEAVEGTDVFTQEQWENSELRKSGYKTGEADRKLINTAMKQSSTVTAGVAQFIGSDLNDADDAAAKLKTRLDKDYTLWNGSTKYVSTAAPSNSEGKNGDIYFRY